MTNTTADPYRGAILLVAAYPFPPRSGSQMRASNIAEALRAHGEVTVLSLDGPEGGDGWLAAANRYRERRASPPRRIRDVGSSVVAGKHAVLSRAEAAGMPGALAREIETRRPSLVILGKPFWGAFVDACDAADAVIIDADESIERAARSFARSRARPSARVRAAVEMLPVRRMERRDFLRASQVWFSTENESDWTASWLSASRRRVVPNVAAIALDESLEAPDVSAIGFVGFYEHAPNEEAALELIGSVMPEVRRRGIELPLHLIGRGPTARMRKAAEGATDVVITGEVDDPPAVLRAAGLLVMPIRTGGGSRVKAVEAIGAGVPIISTAFGVEGLGLVEGKSYVTAEDAGSFATAIKTLTADRTARQALVESALEVARARHSKHALGTSISAALADLGLVEVP